MVTRLPRRRALQVGLALLAATCGSPGGPAPTTVPTALPAAATQASPAAAAASPSPAVVEPAASAAPAAATSVALDLATLGGTRSAWVRAKGEPSGSALGEVFDQNVAVTFAAMPDASERATRVDLLLGHTSGVGDRAGLSVAEAREMARPLHPPDAQAVRSYTDQENQTVEVFRSDLLAEAFRAATRPPPAGGSYFGDQPAGTYVQIAERGKPTTERVVLAVGSPP